MHLKVSFISILKNMNFRSKPCLQRLRFREELRIESNCDGSLRYSYLNFNKLSIGNNLAKVRKGLEENYNFRLAI